MKEFISKAMLSFFGWLKSVYSESDGQGSSTRVHMAALICFILGVGVSFAVSVHHKYVSIEQFDSFLSAGATFIVTCCGALYGINKLGSWADGRNQTNTQSPPQSPPQQ
jgi:hypothetical protein